LIWDFWFCQGGLCSLVWALVGKMFEKRIKELSKDFKNTSSEEFCILTNRDNLREIYFKNNKKAIDFIKIKFNSFPKRIVYFLIKIGLLQPFLKKIKLAEEFGDVVFVANSVKCFNLDKNTVLSLLRYKHLKKDFMDWANFKKKRGEEGYSPAVFSINKKIPFMTEELLEEYKGDDDIGVFKRIYSWYKERGFKKINSKKHIKFLAEKIRKKKVKSRFIEKLLSDLGKKDKDLIFSDLHGSFSKEQILMKDDSYVFIDWSDDAGFEKDLVIRDLASFFREEEDLLGNEDFSRLLKIYPAVVREDICFYLLLNELSSVARRGVFDFNIKRIKNILKHMKRSSCGE
jgi:hypothetical protein